MTIKVLKRFLKHYLGLFVMVSLVQLFFFGSLFLIKGIWFREFWYFLLLVFISLIVYLLSRFYKLFRIYSLSFEEQKTLEEFLLDSPRNSFEETHNALVSKMLELYYREKNQQKKEKRVQKVLIYRFVHQLKTPVSVLKLLSEKNETVGDFEIANKQVETIQYHLNQLLEVYRLDDLKNDFMVESVNLSLICKDVINQLKDYFIAKSVFPKLEIDPSVRVYSDAKWLKLIIFQLVTNAIKYSNPNQQLNFTLKYSEKSTILAIKDQGDGIPKEELSKVFDLFYIGENGRNNGDSSGLGLYIVKTLTQYLGHGISLSSEVGKGTEVTIRFDR
ncbi:sensor histidine kinase [Streptococcus catagoni]|uniref:sensor histidine kinase n=1 Tax=Streptococcus catagoni TaxID=2654874 RepID=UPI00140850AE|nr:HAMP domain-containing sensor histidine kinase [Streptococcus catagoni]